ncbi:hypothetical protein D9O36_12570 [Zobellia amurskyensis]|uniref:CHRD domain-containing protein n=1 Tax=Zobellia amurskyensis TaxID=248905 RepID=A0A7X3D1Y4_9FLAO|nr:hypothetical protein [Zobellia amurskyensis]MUH36679.1 hypothetical protein [Zobellia amurskyensis]
MKTYKTIILIFTVALGLLSCEQERLEPVLTTAEGGGTLSTYLAYTIESTDPSGSNVYGRVVFYKTTLDQTLVQVSLYNTVDGLMHPALILDGASGTETTTTITALDTIDGSTGEFASSKFFVITDESYYDAIETMDAHINIYLSPTDDTIVASSDIGLNAEPVESN